jgi:hypothetical protein
MRVDKGWDAEYRSGMGRKRQPGSYADMRDARAAVVAVAAAMGGQRGLLEWAKSNPDEFWRLYGRLLPREIHQETKTSLAILLARAGNHPTLLGDSAQPVAITVDATSGSTSDNISYVASGSQGEVKACPVRVITAEERRGITRSKQRAAGIAQAIREGRRAPGPQDGTQGGGGVGEARGTGVPVRGDTPEQIPTPKSTSEDPEQEPEPEGGF